MYYLEIDCNHKNWEQKITEKSLKSRISKFKSSKDYHRFWLERIDEMDQLDKHQNSGDLSSVNIKKNGEKVARRI